MFLFTNCLINLFSYRISVYPISYKGCYPENEFSNAVLKTSANVTVENCMEACKTLPEFRYALLKNGNICKCLKSLPIITDSYPKECVAPCQGNEDVYCGGSTHFDVYQIDYTTSVTVTGVDDFEIIVLPSTVLKTGQIFTIEIKTDFTDKAGFLFSFSDGTTKPWSIINKTEHRFNLPNVHTLDINLKNELGSLNKSIEFIIQDPIENLNIEGNNRVNLSDEYSISLSFTNGTNVTCKITDEKEISINRFFSTHISQEKIVIPFSKVNNYTLNITCSNLVSLSTQNLDVIVQEKITDLILSVEPVKAPFGKAITVNWRIKQGTLVTFTGLLNNRDVDLNYEFGKLTGNFITSTTPIGNHTFTLTASNVVSDPVINSVQFQITEGLSDMKLKVESELIRTGYDVIATVYLAKGSLFTTKVSYGDGDTDTYITNDVISNFERVFRHKYKEPGVYLLVVQVTNGLNTFMENATIRVFNTNKFITATTQNVTASEEAVFFYFLSYKDNPKPTNSTMIINFGDGQNRTIDVKRILFPHYERYKYSTEGLYRVQINISNEFDSNNFSRIIQVGHEIKGLTLTTPKATAATSVPLVLTADMKQGTKCRYSLDFDDGEIFVDDRLRTAPFAEKFLSHSWKKEGTFKVILNATNTFGLKSTELKITVQEPVLGLQLTNDGPQIPNKAVNFVLTISEIGTNSCFRWEFGDGRQFLFGFPLCTDGNTDLNFLIIESSVLKISHNYTASGLYKAKVTGWNSVSKAQTTSEVAIDEVLCNIPEVDLQNTAKEYKEANKVLRSEVVQISSTVQMQCKPPKRAATNWELYRVIFQFNGSEKLTVVKFQPQINPMSLTLPKRFLSYGLYKVIVTVYPEGLKTISKKSSGYFLVVPSPLEPVLIGGSRRTTPSNQDLVMDASKSFDPDVDNPAFSNLNYRWYCRQENEVFARNEKNELIDATQVSGAGGCFGDGPGKLSYKTAKPILDRRLFKISKKYVFKLLIYKDDRQAEYDQTVEIIGSNNQKLSIE